MGGMTNNFDPTQARNHPKNKGSWSAVENGTPETTLGTSGAAVATAGSPESGLGEYEPRHEGMDPDCTVTDVLTHDGGDITIATDLNDDGDDSWTVAVYQVFDNDFLTEFEVPRGASEKHVQQAAVAAFDKERMAKAGVRLGQIRSLDTALTAEIHRLNRAINSPLGLRAPADWNNEYELHSVGSVLGDDLNKEQLGEHPDWGSAEEDGLHVGKNLDGFELGRMFVGEQGRRESSSAYRKRWQEIAFADTVWRPMKQHFLDNYDADLIEHTDGSVSVEFVIPYGDGETTDSMSIEAMRERANAHDHLVFVSEHSSIEDFCPGLAAELGYTFDPTIPEDDDGRNAGGRYVRNGD